MIVFKSMFNDVSLGEKSSSSRCVHAEDGGELPRLPACLRSRGGTTHPRVPPVLRIALMSPAPGDGSLGTGRGFALVFGWVLRKLLQDIEFPQGFQVI